MKIKANLDTIILYVQDVENMKSFYTQIFDFSIEEEDGSIWVLLKTGQAKIGLHKIGDQYLDRTGSTSGFHNNTKIVFEIDDDINQIRKNFIDQNISMREIKTFDGYPFWLCDGEDPEGNVFQLKQRK